MPPWDEILAELRAIRQRADQLAALVTGAQAKVDLGLVWSCGHRHQTRGEAMACLRAHEVTGDPIEVRPHNGAAEPLDHRQV